MYAPANNMQSCLAKFYNNKSESYMQAEEVKGTTNDPGQEAAQQAQTLQNSHK